MSFIFPEESNIPESPIELNDELSNGIILKENQKSILKEYMSIDESLKDIAFELPTGYGKTLVGGLIGEFERKKDSRKIVYCCATRQLAAQTNDLLHSYGIESVVLTGNSNNFSQKDLGEYYKGESIVVTTYSHIFNTNPKFVEADLIIFDDAHATEYAIKSLWSLNIKRENKSLYNKFYSLISDIIPENVKYNIESNNYDPMNNGIDIIPQPLWIERMETIKTLLHSEIQAHTNLYYQWSKIRDILHICNIFINDDEIEITPILPPNDIHEAFRNAKKRIYMSATLGFEGDLERKFGVKDIYKMKSAQETAKEVSGSRFMLFPDDLFEGEKLYSKIRDLIESQPRALVLCPSNYTLNIFKEFVARELPHFNVFLSTDIEESLETFKKSNQSILLLSGRYEGIDLKDDECRLQIFFDLPIAVGSSEKFLHSRLKEKEVLKKLLVSRLTQGVGRSTRSEEDYSLLVFIGERVSQYIYDPHFRKLLPSKIEAELNFSLEQSTSETSEETWDNNIKSFYDQDENWGKVKRYIDNQLTQPSNQEILTEDVFSNIAKKEVEFIYNFFEKEYGKAHKIAEEILKLLNGTEEFRPYRAWWNYLIACVKTQQGDTKEGLKFLTNSLNASVNKTWLNRDRLEEIETCGEELLSEESEIQVDKILDIIRKYKNREKKFMDKWGRILDGIKQNDADVFEPQFKNLGEMLGFEAERPNGNGVPDGIWRMENSYLVFEAKTGYEEGQQHIPPKDIRQTRGHKDWVEVNKQTDSEAIIINCLISNRLSVDKQSTHLVNNIHVITHDFIILLAENFNVIMLEVLRELKFNSEDQARQLLIKKFRDNNIFVDDLISTFSELKLSSLVKN
ncbi:helicase C-terminal domain-containing protein [Salinicoccus kekensis]|uniref:DNA 5'-3' helicase n=1 Tax=Salinicoccus kekensis TaxID=714307 RepID=A0A285U6N3_9STAP|nr:helicase C-terminal domain-containing protein [Salinicoccus kekensis]SOC37600.1 type III restriction/modification enzyme restriction subunit [Salinicoccus kekensis]